MLVLYDNYQVRRAKKKYCEMLDIHFIKWFMGNCSFWTLQSAYVGGSKRACRHKPLFKNSFFMLVFYEDKQVSRQTKDTGKCLTYVSLNNLWEIVHFWLLMLGSGSNRVCRCKPIIKNLFYVSLIRWLTGKLRGQKIPGNTWHICHQII